MKIEGIRNLEFVASSQTKVENLKYSSELVQFIHFKKDLTQLN